MKKIFSKHQPMPHFPVGIASSWMGEGFTNPAFDRPVINCEVRKFHLTVASSFQVVYLSKLGWKYAYQQR